VIAFNSTMVLINVTVKNLTITDWENGIAFNNVVYGNVTNIIASLNSHIGVYLESSNGNTLTDNIANLNGDYGIYLDGSSGSVLNNNIADLNKVYGVYLYNK
jgi:parallel beta-helix repeat protein